MGEAGSAWVDNRDPAHHSTSMSQGKSEPAFAEVERRALALENEQRFKEAGTLFDAALKLNPSSQSSSEGRARIALAMKEDDAADHCLRALTFHNANPERQLQMILTVATELGGAAIPLFEDYLHRNPEDIDAHERLSDLRAEYGESDRLTDSYARALREYPRSRPLHMSHWKVLARAGRLDEALASMDASRSLFRHDRDFVVMEANIANYAGRTEQTGRLIDRLDGRPDALLAHGQYCLQTGQPDKAAKLLEAVVLAEPDNLSAWALLEPAWRIIDDPRHEWLIGQPGLYGTTELALGPAELESIGATLRSLHRARSQPLGQSVRGGTQTAGQLFLRTEPDIRLLMEALGVAIGQFLGGLPPSDPGHPTLKHRDRPIGFGPSWSVRLTGGGFHAAHFHRRGILSSACYISLPEAIADSDEKSGWLEIGRPPPELAIDVPPLTTFEPKEGRLILFPSFLFHGTRPFDRGERLTVAFDLVPLATG